MTLDDDWVVIATHIEEPQVYGCAKCNTHLCTEGNVLSKDYTTLTGRGFLVSNVVNTTNGPPESRGLRTGLHTCKDARCTSCDTVVGWLYVAAQEKDNEYKIGKWVLERAKLVKLDWDKDDGGSSGGGGGGGSSSSRSSRSSKRSRSIDNSTSSSATTTKYDDDAASIAASVGGGSNDGYEVL